MKFTLNIFKEYIVVCDLCKKEEAIFHFQENSSSGKRKINLCMNCAIKKGFNFSMFQFQDILIDFLLNIFSPDQNSGYSLGNIAFEADICPSCGKSFHSIVETGEVGCAICYNVYNGYVSNFIYARNNSLNYLGKYPVRYREISIHREKLLELKNELNESILTQDFMKAAKVRDKIKEIKQEFKSTRKQKGKLNE